MNDSTPTVPNSTELQDLFTKVLEANQAATKASALRDSYHPHSDQHEQFDRAAMDAHKAAGAAEEQMRSAIRRSRTALDHVHVCDKPSNADLVRQVKRANDEIRRLRAERDEARRESAAAREQLRLLGVASDPIAKAV